jgi:hypothetical protein
MDHGLLWWVLMDRSRAWGFALAWSMAVVLPACPGVAATPWDHWPDERVRAVRRLGCAELGFAVGRDSRIPDRSLLLDLGVRNHCVRPAPFDANALQFVGYDANRGTSCPLTIYDPRDEIRPTQIDAENESVERIRLDPPGGSLATITSVCVDTSRVSPEAAQAAPAPVCVEVSP